MTLTLQACSRASCPTAPTCWGTKGRDGIYIWCWGPSLLTTILISSWHLFIYRKNIPFPAMQDTGDWLGNVKDEVLVPGAYWSWTLNRHTHWNIIAKYGKFYEEKRLLHRGRIKGTSSKASLKRKWQFSWDLKNKMEFIQVNQKRRSFPGMCEEVWEREEQRDRERQTDVKCTWNGSYWWYFPKA